MKNQYFGDKRDLLKFSLLEALAQGIPAVTQLTCIWLLTPPSLSNDGNRHFRQHVADSPLAQFLKECIANGRRDVREFASYMASRPTTYASFGDDASHYFTAKTRTTYFTSIPDSALRNAVVFFDPDNGLEPTASFSAAHLRYTELRTVVDRMDETSIGVVYQHLPRVSAETFWPAIANRVRSALGCSAGFVASGDVGFVLIARDQTVAQQLNRAVHQFALGWPYQLRNGRCATASS